MGLEASFRLIFLTNNFGQGIFLVLTGNLGDFWSLGTWATWREPTASLDPRGIYNSGHLLFFECSGFDLCCVLLVEPADSASEFSNGRHLVRGHIFFCASS